MENLTEAIVTRISHDLIGNIGAVANAVELMEDNDADFFEDIKSILATSSFTMSARLKFFRMAFGLGNVSADFKAVQKISADYVKTLGSKSFSIVLNMQEVPDTLFRPAMLSTMAAADCFIKGGEIEVLYEDSCIKVKAASVNPLNADKIETMKKISEGKTTTPDAAFAPLFYLLQILRNMNYIMQISSTMPFSFIIKGI